MSWLSPMRKFRCRLCGSLDVLVTGRLSPNAVLRCARCDCAITTWRLFVAGLERPSAPLVFAPGGTSRYPRQ
jgi:hypothetical protein